MKTRNKALLTILCAFALIACSVFGTYAYLTSSATVTNTFSVGNVTITMDEAAVSTDGELLYKTDAGGDPTTEPLDRVTTNAYHLLPGHFYVKDPTVHVAANSENCYIFVKIDNGISGIEATGTEKTPSNTDYTTIKEQIKAKGWSEYTGETNVYYIEHTKQASAKDYIVFENFMISGTATNDSIKAYETKTENEKQTPVISIEAYAIQKDGIADVTTAWNAVTAASNP